VGVQRGDRPLRRRAMIAPLALRDALARLGAPDALESFAPLTGAPLLCVELDGDDGGGPADAPTARVLEALPAPTVALVRDPAAPAARRWAGRFDVVVPDADALASLARAVGAAPLAAATLAQLLRHADARSIEAGLVAESLAYSVLQAGPEFAAWLRRRETRPAAADPAAPAPLRVERRDELLALTLDRAEKRNAYSAALRDALVEALALAAADASIRRVVLAGTGPAFCAGGDLTEFGRLPDPATAHAVRTTRSAARLLAALAPRVEARVHGACVGAGIELAAFAERVVAREDAWFALPELGMGLLPGAGGTVSLPRRIGRQRTAWLALTGARLDAAAAREWGLVDEVVSRSAW
jgi:enoyl-CoA hydratase/carnithine racemase